MPSARNAGRFRLPAVLALLLALVACAPRTPQAEFPSDTRLEDLPTPDPSTIVWALGEPPSSLDAARLAIDPQRAILDPAGAQVCAQIYDRLVAFRPGTVQLAPGLAERWQSNVTGDRFTFTLREGLSFHDGTPLDARAVAWNFERWMNPEHSSHHGDFRVWEGLFGYLGQPDGSGEDAFLVESVEAIGPLQVRFSLRAPFAPFPYHIASSPFGLASPRAVEAQGEAYGSDGAHLPVGSGPYRVLAWEEGEVRLAPFEGYWGGPPASSGLRFVVEPDEASRSAGVAQGQYHGTELRPTTVISGDLSAAGVTLMPRPARSSAWLMLDHSRTPLDDPRVREALSLALDRGRLTREHFGELSLPATQLLPPGFLGREDSIQSRDFNPDEARRILRDELGITGNFRLNIWVAESPRAYLPDPVGTAAAVAEMLQAIGIEAKVRTAGLRQFLRDRETGRFTAWITGWEAQSADPDNFWYWHFGIPRRVAAEGHYDNESLRNALTQAQRVDTDTRDALYREAARTVDEATTRIFLAHVQPILLLSSRLSGYTPGPMGTDDFSSAFLSESSQPAAPEVGPSPPTRRAPDLPSPMSSLPTATAEASPESQSTATGESGDEDADGTPTVVDEADPDEASKDTNP